MTVPARSLSEEAEVVLDFLGGPDRPFPGLVAARRFLP